MTLWPAGRLYAQARPSTLLDRAMKAAGGESRLREYRGLEWTGLGVVHIPDRDITIRGTWEIQPPDSAVVATYDTTRGPGTLRYLIVAGARGWIKRDTVFTPLPEDILAEEQHQYYLYSLLRLVPLKEKGVKLHAVFPDSAGTRRVPGGASGTTAGDDVLRFGGTGGADGDAVRAAGAGGGRPAGARASRARPTSNGVRWFKRMEILRAGKPYFDLDVDSLAMKRSIEDPLLAGPALTTGLTRESRRATSPPRCRATPAAGRRPHRS